MVFRVATLGVGSGLGTQGSREGSRESQSAWIESHALASPVCNLTACNRQSKILPGFSIPLRIERALDLLHQLEAAVAHLLPEPGLLREADAVFAGDRAAERRASSSTIASSARCTRCISSASRSSVRNVGCRLPSPMWPNVPICRSNAARGLGDEADHRRQLAARHGDVLEDRRRPAPGERGKRVAPRRRRAAALRPRRAPCAPRARGARGRSPPSAAASSATAAGWPSVSISSTAAQSVGRPTCAYSSTQRAVI